MRIRNDYTGFSGKGYQDNYLYKNKEAAKENDSQADRTKPDGANTENTVYRKRESTYSRDGDTCQITHTVEKGNSRENTHTGILKEFWNSLGDEGQTAETGGQSLHLMAAFQNIKAAFQNFVKEHITEPVPGIPTEDPKDTWQAERNARQSCRWENGWRGRHAGAFRGWKGKEG
ncbi:MAG: hypothetical protein V8S42_00555 [Lachnospiraceae bacterium]